MPKLEFDPNYELSYGMWRCPECKSEFFPGLTALHNRDCSQSDLSGCILVIGPHAVARAKERGEGKGFPDIKDIREQLPDVET